MCQASTRPLIMSGVAGKLLLNCCLVLSVFLSHHAVRCQRQYRKINEESRCLFVFFVKPLFFVSRLMFLSIERTLADDEIWCSSVFKTRLGVVCRSDAFKVFSGKLYRIEGCSLLLIACWWLTVTWHDKWFVTHKHLGSCPWKKFGTGQACSKNTQKRQPIRSANYVVQLLMKPAWGKNLQCRFLVFFQWRNALEFWCKQCYSSIYANLFWSRHCCFRRVVSLPVITPKPHL